MKKEEVKSKLFDIEWRKLLTGDIDLSRDDFIQALFLRFAYNEKQDWDAKKIQEEFRNLACTVAAFVRYKGIEPENSFIEEFTNILVKYEDEIKQEIVNQ